MFTSFCHISLTCSKDRPIFEQHYLSQAEFNHIRQKYIDAYRIKESWTPNIEILEEYLNEGGIKDKYEESYTDDDGIHHTGQRGFEKVKPIKEQIREIIINEIGEGNISEKIINRIDNAVMNTISDCKNFYKFDREESSFSCSVSLGPSPTSNQNTVQEYWKSKGVDIEITDPNPLLIWEMDYYGDEFEDYMESEYGNEWKKIFDDKLEDIKQNKNNSKLSSLQEN